MHTNRDRDPEKQALKPANNDETIVVGHQSQQQSRSKAKFKALKYSLLCFLLLLATISLRSYRLVPFQGSNCPQAKFDLYEASVDVLKSGLENGCFTSESLVNAYLDRIGQVKQLNAVIETNPKQARQRARELDVLRKQKWILGPLHGIPVLIKDNIGTDGRQGLRTTSGSFALYNTTVTKDSTVVEKLRIAGAIIIGTLNMSEFANQRGNDIPPGWSARGGQTLNPYVKNSSPCGSSSGSGVAAAIGLATVTLGTETDGSITCPASFNNVVGIKPTLGLTSRHGVIPVSEHQDSVGPLTRTVKDGAFVLNIIAGTDVNDPPTLNQPKNVPDFVAALKPNALRGKLIGVPRHIVVAEKYDPFLVKTFDTALTTIEGLGATTVEVFFDAYNEIKQNHEKEEFILNSDLKAQMNDYLTAHNGSIKTLTDIIAFIKRDPIENIYNTDKFDDAETTNRYSDINFNKTLANNRVLGRTRGIDKILTEHSLDAIVLPATGFTSTPPALAGYPIVTVPLGFYPSSYSTQPSKEPSLKPAPNLPFGLSFLGRQWDDSKLISYAYAYEQASGGGKTTRLSGPKAYVAPTTKYPLGSYSSVKRIWPM